MIRPAPGTQTVSAAALLRYEGALPEAGAWPGQEILQVWDAEAIDALTETVVTGLLVQGRTAREIASDAIDRLARQAPGLPALCLALPFTLAASAIEEMLGAGPQARTAALDAWRVSSLIGADALVLRARGEGRDTIAALHALWQEGDDVFGRSGR